METDSLSVASTQSDEEEQVTVVENPEAVTDRTSDGQQDDNGYSRHFKKNTTNTSSSASRSPGHNRNIGGGGRGGRMRQVSFQRWKGFLRIHSYNMLPYLTPH
ncbi:unnamed protein product [Cylicostephanus goldi]|uniref:Uncharacterized protein n=1 Tax=Cylicostephanus goldi TaxID=71465 RepID=A0A3P6RXM5_CYLGO|nr:unnamed protein product [Cylicostephanus goldi]